MFSTESPFGSLSVLAHQREGEWVQGSNNAQHPQKWYQFPPPCTGSPCWKLELPSSDPVRNGLMALSVKLQLFWVTKQEEDGQGEVRHSSVILHISAPPKANQGEFIGANPWMGHTGFMDLSALCTNRGFPRLWDVWGAGAGAEGQAGHQEKPQPSPV